MFYRIDDIGTLTGPRFLALALRVSAYQGVISARLAELEQEQEPTRSNGSEVTQVESTRQAITADPVLSGVISWGGG